MTKHTTRFDRYIDTKRQLTQASHVRLRELRGELKKPSRVYKQAKREVKSSRYELKEAKAGVKEAIAAQKDLRTSRQALEEAKAKLKTAKLTKRSAKKAAGGSSGQRLAKTTASTLHRQRSQLANTVLSEDDTLANLASARFKIMQSHRAARSVRLAGRLVGSSSKTVLKNSYQIGNRFYNLKAGRGFTVTPKEFSWHGRAGARFRAWKQKMGQKRGVQILKGAKRVGGWAAKPAVAVLKNPLSFKAYIIVFLFVLLLSMFGGSGIAIQDEYDLNETWLYLTKRDREKSTDKVDYWTNWEDSLLYINHNYDTIADTYGFKPEKTIPENLFGKGYLDTLWKDLNKDKNNLKTMADLYTKEGSVFYLEKEELEEYEELLEESMEIGKFAQLLELANPFYLPDNPQVEQPLIITKRFGYSDKKTINKETELLASAGQILYAPMSGKVTVKDGHVTITDSQAKFTFKNVTDVKVATGDQVSEQDVIGAVSDSGQVITYQKLLVPTKGEKDKDGNIKAEWVSVNPGFYFQHVTYTQATSVLSDIDASGDKAKRARRFYNIVKKHVPDATVEGISAALGGFDIESSITFKRYEADMFTDNKYDRAAEEPTVEHLLGGWSAFYDLYLNSPPDHRPNPMGYLYDGKHYIGVGLGQWTGPRAFALWSFAKENNLDMWSEEAQVRFLLEGDSPYYRDVFLKTITGTGSTDELTEYFLNNWLGVPGNKIMERQHAAKQWYNFLNNQSSGTTGIASKTIPDGYDKKLPNGLPSDKAVSRGQGYSGNGYELGNCTWYVYNRMQELGTPIYAYLGNANMWAETGRARGYEVSTKPKVGSVAVFLPGVAGSHSQYGHVGIVEYVNADGTYLMSEMNFTGLYNLTWRTLSPQEGTYFMTPK